MPSGRFLLLMCRLILLLILSRLLTWLCWLPLPLLRILLLILLLALRFCCGIAGGLLCVGCCLGGFLLSGVPGLSG